MTDKHNLFTINVVLKALSKMGIEVLDSKISNLIDEDNRIIFDYNNNTYLTKWDGIRDNNIVVYGLWKSDKDFTMYGDSLINDFVIAY